MATKCLIDISTQNFKKLFDLTKEILTIPKEVNYDSIVQKKSERWNILLDIWQSNCKWLEKNIFLNPLTHIFCGEYRSHNREKTIRLFQEIEYTLINDNEAFSAWSQSILFHDAFPMCLLILFIRHITTTLFASFKPHRA